MTRKEYLAPFISDSEAAQRHRRYYSQFVNDQVLALVQRHIGVAKLQASRDPHFNDIRLRRWDGLAHSLPKTVISKLREAGDYLTNAGGVCILKEAAQQIVAGDA